MAQRGHGALLFLNIQDGTSNIQVILMQDKVGESGFKFFEETIDIGDFIEVQGVLIESKTGEKSLEATNFEVLTKTLLPLPEKWHGLQDTEEKLRKRYLDILFNPEVKQMIEKRSIFWNAMREFLIDKGFLEVETPVLEITTGGADARPFITHHNALDMDVYLRISMGELWQKKLMVAGFERYFQIARCFRDEDPRGDRQQEFTQLDFEISFPTQEEIWELTEKLIISLIEELYPRKHFTKKPFPKITWKEAQDKYKTDKPDMRKDKNDNDEIAACWIIDFPMFEKDAKGKITTAHHPFTMPNEEDIHLLDKNPYKVRAYSYDLVINGYEISSGSIRIHNREIQNKIFEILGLSKEETELRFGHILRAFEYGAPPHGGFAPGIDRLTMILQNEPSIREIIAFPKTGDGRDLMMGAPSDLPVHQLKEAGIDVKKFSTKIDKHYKKN